MRHNESSNIRKLSALTLSAALIVSALLIAQTASAQSYRSTYGSSRIQSTQGQESAYTRLEEVKGIYKDDKSEEYMLFLANTPSVIIINRETKFKSAFGTEISYYSAPQMLMGRIIKVEATRDNEGRLVAGTLTILEPSAETMKILNESRKIVPLGPKDMLNRQSRGSKSGR